MMYTRTIFGKALKEKLKQQLSVVEIGAWAHSVYLKHIHDIDLDFRDILLTLNTMELGPEFAFTYQELNNIADDLIVGKNINL